MMYRRMTEMVKSREVMGEAGRGGGGSTTQKQKSILPPSPPDVPIVYTPPRVPVRQYSEGNPVFNNVRFGCAGNIVIRGCGGQRSYGRQLGWNPRCDHEFCGQGKNHVGFRVRKGDLVTTPTPPPGRTEKAGWQSYQSGQRQIVINGY